MRGHEEEQVLGAEMLVVELPARDLVTLR